MKLLLIRHGDPDYERDSLTPKGFREAQHLSERLASMNINYVYVSPLGRAKDTAAFTLEKIGLEAKEQEWLREFAPRIYRPDKEQKIICWDWLPKDWTAVSDFYNKDCWHQTPVMKDGAVDQEYHWVVSSFDALLETHGYKRTGNYYQAVKSNSDVIAFFCHFGLECVLLAHLLGISPMLLWHGACAAPSSVTTLVTEERRKGDAYFRMTGFGDVSHLYAANEEASKAARFCECFENQEERHD